LIATSARKVIEDWLAAFREKAGDSLLGLHAVRATEEGQIEEQIPMLLNWDDARMKSEQNISNLSRLERWYVTGKIQKPKESNDTV